MLMHSLRKEKKEIVVTANLLQTKNLLKVVNNKSVIYSLILTRYLLLFTRYSLLCTRYSFLFTCYYLLECS